MKKRIEDSKEHVFAVENLVLYLTVVCTYILVKPVSCFHIIVINGEDKSFLN